MQDEYFVLAELGVKRKHLIVAPFRSPCHTFPLAFHGPWHDNSEISCQRCHALSTV